MQTLICPQPAQLVYQDLPIPSPGPEEILLRIKHIGICGTDLHAFDGTQPFFNYPRRLGHELSAVIVDEQLNQLSGKKDPFAVIPYIECGHCIACRSGRVNCCSRLKVLGVHEDGGMAEYFCVPESKILHGRGLDAERLALIEPLAIGAHAISRANVAAGEVVLVMGAGPIGLGIMLQCRLAGATVVALDINKERLKQATEIGKADYIVDAGKSSVKKLLGELSHDEMFSVLFDATGSLAAINAGLNYVAHGGRFVLVGLQKKSFEFSHPEFHKRETTLMSSRNAVKDDFEKVISYVVDGQLDPLTLVTHRIHFNELADQFPRLLDPTEKVIKALIHF